MFPLDNLTKPWSTLSEKEQEELILAQREIRKNPPAAARERSIKKAIANSKKLSTKKKKLDKIYSELNKMNLTKETLLSLFEEE